MNFETTRWAVLVGVVAALGATDAAAQVRDAEVYDEDFFAQIDGHAAAISDSREEQILSGGLGYALRAGWRWGRFGAFAEGGQAAWFATGIRRDFAPGVLNLGLGGEYRFHDGQVRSSLSAGTSTLLFDTVLDPAGTTGWYLNLRPAALRWGITDSLAFEFAPVTFMMMQPVVSGETLTKVEYQAVLALEFQ